MNVLRTLYGVHYAILTMILQFLPLFPKNTSAENHCKNKDPCQNDRIDIANRFLYPAAFGV